ncbi:MAG TPA: YdeI/OmpD-associated family protein [Candidatus Acidoferrum sp.]|nr:YdeI/OmpD-associated family protein [Candidatus Acidoferrum sp.]
MSDAPKDFSDALKAAGLAGFYADCTGPHRREYLQWIAEAKRPETRQARIKRAVQMLVEKRAEETARSKKTSR